MLAILIPIVSHTSCWVACLRLTVPAVDLRNCVYCSQSAASVFSHIMFFIMGLDDIVNLTGRGSEGLAHRGVMK